MRLLAGLSRAGLSRKATVVWIGLSCFAFLAGVSTLSAADASLSAPSVYRSPYLLAVSRDGKTLYVSDQTARCVAVLNLTTREKTGEIATEGQPRDLCLSPDGNRLYVAERGAGTVAVIDTSVGKVAERIPVDKWPISLAFAPDGNRLYVGNQDSHTVWAIDLTQTPPAAIHKVRVVREPSCIAVTPNGQTLVVTNLLPDGVGTDPTLSAVVSIIDAASLKQTSTIKLPPGSTSVNGVCTSPDGKWAYVVHGLGRFNLPITQLERGWVSTYALTIIDLAQPKRLATLLLDDLTRGAADPFSVVCAPDGSRLWISHAGVHEVSLIEIGKVHELLAGKVPEDLAALKDGMQPNIWVRIQKNAEVISELENDLTALYIAGAIRRAKTGGNGPRGLALAPDAQQLYVANYYAGNVGILEANEGRLLGSISMGPQPPLDGARRGEMLFHDATLAFQRWHSCASCHPNQARVDGLRWDFLRDGIGNGKDTINLVYVDKTEPLNRRGTRATARECARSSVEAGHMIVPTEQDVDDLYAYLKSLQPEPSPHRATDGGLTDAAKRGKILFETEADCVRCHPGPYFTDQETHNVGVLSPSEPDGLYDTPALIEAYRTAPYLHDGRARTLRDVLTIHNEKGLHGETSDLTDNEIGDLEAYLLSL
ncbi:MAG: beta-propeller fold lactonase family protein [Pirellulaceae bacterium]